MEENSTSRLATETRSVALQMEGARAAVAAGAPAVDIAARLSSITASLHEIGRHTGGHGLLFAPGPLVTPDIPVLLRALAESSVGQGTGDGVATNGTAGNIQDKRIDAYNAALHSLVADLPGMLATSRPGGAQ